MAGFVLDCSVAVAWGFEDEATVELDALLDRVQHQGAVVPPLRVVPPLWISEASNVLLMAQRRGRIGRVTMQERLGLLDMLPIQTDDMASGTVWRSSVLTLADVEALTFYDAIYLGACHPARAAACQQRCCAGPRRRGIVVLPAEPR